MNECAEYLYQPKAPRLCSMLASNDILTETLEANNYKLTCTTQSDFAVSFNTASSSGFLLVSHSARSGRVVGERGKGLGAVPRQTSLYGAKHWQELDGQPNLSLSKAEERERSCNSSLRLWIVQHKEHIAQLPVQDKISGMKSSGVLSTKPPRNLKKIRENR